MIPLTPTISLPRRTLSLSVLVCLLGTGCAREAQPSTPDLCYRAFPAAEEGVTPAVTTGDLRALVLGREPGSTAPASADCAGKPIALPPAGPSCPAIEGGAATAVPVTDERVIERAISGVDTIVWVMTHDVGGGEALGPVALVERRPTGLAVLAMGMLRAGRERPSFRIERLGDTEVLVAESDACSGEAPADGTTASSCVRTSTLLLREASILASTSVVDQDGTCVGPAVLELSRTVDHSLDTGWQRRFALNASVAPDENGSALVVQEQVTVFESDPRHPDVPARRIRVADAQRSLTPAGGVLVVDRPALLSRILHDSGSMRADETTVVTP